MAQLVRKRAVWNLVSGLCKYSAAFPHQNMVVSKFKKCFLNYVSLRKCYFETKFNAILIFGCDFIYS